MVDNEMKLDAEFCEAKCPICTRARRGNRLALWLVKYIDRKICPACKAYEKKYNKPAYE